MAARVGCRADVRFCYDSAGFKTRLVPAVRVFLRLLSSAAPVKCVVADWCAEVDGGLRQRQRNGARTAPPSSPAGAELVLVIASTAPPSAVRALLLTFQLPLLPHATPTLVLRLRTVDAILRQRAGRPRHFIIPAPSPMSSPPRAIVQNNHIPSYSRSASHCARLR